MKRFYNAIFTSEAEGGYVVTFHDVPNTITQGDTLEEAYEMALDVLGLMLQNKDGTFNHPTITSPNNIAVPNNSFLVIIQFDELEYLKKHGNVSVKKTLTIPQWLNTAAVEKNINFSQTLQEALKIKLNLL